jgi:hypothetical protein
MEHPILRKHVTLLQLNDKEKDLVKTWLKDVQHFFNTTGKSRLPLPLAEKVRDPSYAFRIHHPTRKSSTSVEPMSFTVERQDIVEAATIQYAVQLISVLGNYDEEVRNGAISLLFKLAKVFDLVRLEPLESTVNGIITGSSSDDRKSYEYIHQLFKLIAPSLSNMAVALVTGLECFYTCYDWNVRSVCISALSRIVYENEKIFIEEDQLNAIWNLYFCLNNLPSIDKLFPDRITLIKSLALLVKIYCPTDLALSFRIMESLLRLKEKVRNAGVNLVDCL